jgi:hypothetical protein
MQFSIFYHQGKDQADRVTRGNGRQDSQTPATTAESRFVVGSSMTYIPPFRKGHSPLIRIV